jgi:hypothetical protein
MVHGAVRQGPCQKILCSATNEVNIQYHCWVFPKHEIAQGKATSTNSPRVGLFDTHGIEPAHEDVKDPLCRGMPFGKLEARKITIHGANFSPCNNQFALKAQTRFFGFFQLCAYHERRVLSYHVGCTSPQAEKELAAAVRPARTVAQLCAALQEFPCAAAVKSLLDPLLRV